MHYDPQRGKRRPEDRPAPLPNAITYTLPDAARISGLSQATLRRRAAEGALRLFRVGGRTLVNGDSLRALLTGARQMQEAA
ncbi:helix-turn-helix domain-containing protein [Falsiroseomonas oryziterrae]|uniref:helix-turn-helix domain-containing protein n=1 Tax=Falsiroseomonas oryziterrae TaxID=2911368 RepID=UPI001F46FCEF|nr:helix-turn-helix domain-containing protein [Roseomonas sp. NPKOSM-4]